MRVRYQHETGSIHRSIHTRQKVFDGTQEIVDIVDILMRRKEFHGLDELVKIDEK